MPTGTTFDILVISGGPGGATTAAGLAQAGHHVLLLEQAPFPRFHMGEGLPPALWDIWDRLQDTYNWHVIFETRERHNIFARSLKAPLLRRRLVMIASGGYEAGEPEVLRPDLDVNQATSGALVH